MELSVLGEYGEFTVVGFTRTHLRIRFMKFKKKHSKRMRRMELSAVGEKANDINLSLIRRIFEPDPKNFDLKSTS
jgi:hypothetical protein